MSRSFVLKLGVSAVAVGMVATTPAYAQLDEIVITAQKREQTLSDVPISVSAFSGESLRLQNVSDIRDLALISPAISAPTSTTLFGTSFIIRGQGSATTDPGVEQSVGIFIDGIFRSRSTAALGEFLDIERIEVLKGPQGTIFGRNSSAGAVSVMLKEPTQDFSGEIQGGYGRFDAFNIKGSINGPLNDNIAVRISASHRQQNKGDVENLAGADLGVEERSMIRGQVKVESGATSLRLTADFSDIDENCCTANALFYSDADIATLSFLGATLPGLATSTPAVVQGVSGRLFDPFDRVIALNDRRNVQIEDWGVSGHFDHDFEWASLSIVAAYRAFDADNLQDFDTVDVPAGFSFPGVVTQDSEEVSVELRLAGETGPVNWLVGGYFFDQDFTASQTVLAFGINGAGGDLETQNFAVFGQGIWSITDRIDFTGGVRFTSEDKTATYFGAFLAPIVNANLGVPFSNDEDEVLGDAAVSYSFSDSNSIYFRYGRGYKSPGLNLNPTSLTSTSIEDFFFDSEASNAFEVGTKMALFDQLSLNVAGYYQKIKNLQVQFVDTSALGNFTDNVGAARSYGVDTDFVWQPNDQLTLSGGVSYLDAEYTSFTDGPQDAITTSPATFQDLSGETPFQAPKWSASANAQYVQPVANGVFTLTPQASVTFRGSHTTTLANEELFANDGTVLVNLSLEFAHVEQGWSIQGFGKNVTNEEVIVRGTGVPATLSGAATINEPATWGIVGRLSF